MDYGLLLGSGQFLFQKFTVSHNEEFHFIKKNKLGCVIKSVKLFYEYILNYMA